MAAIPQPPPPPPPMPGTSGAFIVPNWRENYQSPFHETVLTKEQIEKQQYAHLPDKLLNTMNKDKKPFTYTPSGVSSEKGVLDLSEIRSPKMKKRLLANLHAGEEEDQDQSANQELAKTNNQQQQNSQQPNVYQCSASPLVLPPISDVNNRFRSPSPNYGQQQYAKKEVRFAPSPVPTLACNDNELINKLAARKQDVEARSTIVTNDPIVEDENVDGSQQQQQQQQQQQSTTKNLSSPVNTQEFEDMSQLCLSAAEAVRTARRIIDDTVDRDKNNRYEPTVNQLGSNFDELRFDDETVTKKQSQNLYRQQNSTSNPNTNPSQILSQSASYNTDILKHVLDTGLQDEIDRFEEMGAKMGSTSPDESTYSSLCSINKQPSLDLPSKSQIYQDGRTSCPPFPNHQSNSNQDFMNSFRCISPSVEILKKTQITGYNYVSKPRPFYRAVEENTSAFRPINSFKPIDVQSTYQNDYPNQNEKMIPIRIEEINGYSASLPRKIKLNQDPSQPKSYENPELGRDYLLQAGMFSQLPPKSINNSTSSENLSQDVNKMFYGVNPRKTSKFHSTHAKNYVDPEANREYLREAGMFSQLPPPPQTSFYNSNNNANSLYSFKSRQSSLPPSTINCNISPGPQSPATPPIVNSCKSTPNKPLSLSELRKLPASERPHEPAPSKYTGANIPSRSFRILQLITGEDVPNQFVQKDNEWKKIPESQRSQPPPSLPKNDSYRSASQQPSKTNSFEQSIRSTEPISNVFNQSNQQSTMSSMYSSSAYGTDF